MKINNKVALLKINTINNRIKNKKSNQINNNKMDWLKIQKSNIRKLISHRFIIEIKQILNFLIWVHHQENSIVVIKKSFK